VSYPHVFLMGAKITSPGDFKGKFDFHAGRYSLLRELGHGGMGITWLCYDTTDNAKARVVVKGILGELNEPLKKLFAQESQRLREAGTTGIAPAFIETFSEGEVPYFVQEYIQGKTLSSLVESFDESEVKIFCRQALLGLQILHQKNIIHRDIKLSNLMKRDTDGKYFFIDFGVSRLLQPLETSGGSHVGTPGYMAPEMVLCSRSTYKTDTYCLGLCALALIVKSEGKAIREVSSLRPQLRTLIQDQSLANCIMSMLHPNEQDRTDATTSLQFIS